MYHEALSRRTAGENKNHEYTSGQNRQKRYSFHAAPFPYSMILNDFISQSRIMIIVLLFGKINRSADISSGMGSRMYIDIDISCTNMGDEQ
jgi:hypothetical protein